jgi:chromosomal replication initiator protein
MGMSAELLSADLLIIDDIQFLVGKEKTQDHFCKILNSLTAMDKQVVVTCDKSPDSFKSVPGKKVQKSLDEKLLHKLRNGMSIEILKLDVETRELLLRRKIQDFRLSGYITEDVIQALTEVPLSNVRELEGVLNKLFAYKELLKRDITVDMVRIILGDTTRNMASPVTIERIIKVVSKEMEISGEMLVSMSRIQKAALPRKVAMYLCRELTDNSLHTVGLHFNRDYSTVIFNIKALVKLMQRDKDLARKIREIKEQLQNNS